MTPRWYERPAARGPPPRVARRWLVPGWRSVDVAAGTWQTPAIPAWRSAAPRSRQDLDARSCSRRAPSRRGSRRCELEWVEAAERLPWSTTPPSTCHIVDRVGDLPATGRRRLLAGLQAGWNDREPNCPRWRDRRSLRRRAASRHGLRTGAQPRAPVGQRGAYVQELFGDASPGERLASARCSTSTAFERLPRAGEHVARRVDTARRSAARERRELGARGGVRRCPGPVLRTSGTSAAPDTCSLRALASYLVAVRRSAPESAPASRRHCPGARAI